MGYKIEEQVLKAVELSQQLSQIKAALIAVNSIRFSHNCLRQENIELSDKLYHALEIEKDLAHIRLNDCFKAARKEDFGKEE